jgi:hypothetical protein
VSGSTKTTWKEDRWRGALVNAFRRNGTNAARAGASLTVRLVRTAPYLVQGGAPVA